MSHPVFRFITKATAIFPEWVFFRRKTYYEDRRQKNRHLKGGAIYVSNHTSFWDYICLFFVVYLHCLRPVVSDLIYRKNPVLRFFLNMVGAIVVGKDQDDVNYIDKCVSLLRRGKKIIIFPEAHFIHDGHIRSFAPSFALIAIKANVPVIPVYVDGQYSFWKRTRVMIGKRISTGGYSLDLESAKELASFVQGKVVFFQDRVNRRSKDPLWNPSIFPMDFGRLTVGVGIFGPVFRPQKHAVEGEKGIYNIDGPLIIACNHRSFMDAVILICALWRKRLWILIAKEVFGETETDHRLRKKLLKDIGGIKIDRSALDIDAIRKCSTILQEGKCLLAFPEGHLHKGGKTDSLKDGVALLSCQNNVPILPVYLCKAKRFTSTRHLYFGKMITPEEGGLKAIKKTSATLQDSFGELRDLAIEEGREYE